MFLQKINTMHWQPFGADSVSVSGNLIDNQVIEIKFKKVGAKKLRSLRQLAYYWVCIDIVFENTVMFMNEEELSEYIKLKIGYIESVIYIDGHQHMKTGSISIDKMEHFAMCGYMDKALDVMSEIIGVDIETFKRETKQRS